MIGVSSIGVVILLAVLVIAMLALVAKLRADKPKRAQKWEKAKIMKQLLELSDRENRPAATVSSVRLRAPGLGQGMRTSNAHLKTTARTPLPIRSKTR